MKFTKETARRALRTFIQATVGSGGRRGGGDESGAEGGVGMSVKTYPAGQQLTPHFNSSEFKCKCCGTIKTDMNLLNLLESLFPALGLSKINVISGYNNGENEGGSGEE